METVGSVISRTLPTLVGKKPNGQSYDMLAAHRGPKTLRDLVARFEDGERLEFPDQVLTLSELRLTEHEEIAIPDRGDYVLTDWSRKQLGVILGVKLDKYFDRASLEERADELNRRLRRATGKICLRTSAEGSDIHSGGTLTAFVSPGYTPVKDSVVARMLIDALGPVDSQLHVVRSAETEMTTTYVVKIGEAFKPGDSHEVGDIWGCALVRNSNVGYASLCITTFLHRLLCKNGMTAPIPEPVLLRRRHSALGEDRLRSMLAESLERLPRQLAEGAERLRWSRARAVPDVEEALTDFLDKSDLPRRHLPALLTAYAAEPHASAFGVVQAVTLAAQSLSPEERFDLERAAGAYLVSNAANT